MTGMERLLGFLLLAALATPGLASCFGRDASWRVGVTAPLHCTALLSFYLLTLIASSAGETHGDPAKQERAWEGDGGLVSDPQQPTVGLQCENYLCKPHCFYQRRCVDKFTVWAWPDGTNRTGITARRIPADKAVKSVIVNVEACVNYRQVLASYERYPHVPVLAQVFGGAGGDRAALPAGVHRRAAAAHRGAARRAPPPPSHLHCWLPLGPAQEGFRPPNRIHQISSSISHSPQLSRLHSGAQEPLFMVFISLFPCRQVTGTEVRSVTRASPGTTASMTAAVQWRHLATRSGSPHLSVGQASTLPARVGGRSLVGWIARSLTLMFRLPAAHCGQGQHPPRPAPRRRLTLWPGGEAGLLRRAAAAARGRNAYGRPSECITWLTQAFVTRLWQQVKERGPWLRDMIELQVPVPDCAEFNFEVSAQISQKRVICILYTRCRCMARGRL